jgi:hypothetical protein
MPTSKIYEKLSLDPDPGVKKHHIPDPHHLQQRIDLIRGEKNTTVIFTPALGHGYPVLIRIIMDITSDERAY